MNITTKKQAVAMESQIIGCMHEHKLFRTAMVITHQRLFEATATKYGHQTYYNGDRLRLRTLMHRSGLRLDVACKRRLDRWANSRVEFHWTYDEFFRRIAKEDFEGFLFAAVDEFEETA